MNLVVYCADIGSVPEGPLRLGSSRRRRGGDGGSPRRTEIAELVDAVAGDLAAERPVALGFECPLFVPVPEEPLRLGMARVGDGNRAWSAGAGSGALATEIVEGAWVLHELRQRHPEASVHLTWTAFVEAGHGLLLWEAFVTDRAKTPTHVDDAAVAVAAFRSALPDPASANAVTAERPLSLLGAALVWSGWSDERELLRTPCLVIKAAPPAVLDGTSPLNPDIWP